MSTMQSMTVKENFDIIAKILSDIIQKNEHTNFYKDQCGQAQTLLKQIKQNFEEKEKTIEALTERNKNTPPGERSLVKMDEKSQTTLQDLQNVNKRLIEENQKLKQTLTELENSSEEVKLRQVDKLNHEKKKLQEEVEELSKRLSSVTGQQITKNNPAIADLSDPYRPTKLAEVFGLLYDNQWTDAFSSFEKTKRKEDEVINILGEIVKRADRFCTESFRQVAKCIRDYVTNCIIYPEITIPRSGQDISCKPRNKVTIESTQACLVEGHINDSMKALAAVTGKQLADIFLNLPMDLVKKTLLKSDNNVKYLDIFAEEAVKIIWMMKVQQPPMELVWAEPGSKYNKEMFSFYVSKGEKVMRCIWPAVLLHEKGPVIARGIVHGQ